MQVEDRCSCPTRPRRRGAVGDAGRGRRQGRRVRVDPHAAELHQHVRRDQAARDHADGRHHRTVLRHADDRPPQGRRATAARTRTAGTSATTATATSCRHDAGHGGVGHEHLPRQGAAVRQAGARCDDDRVQRVRRADVRQRAHRRSSSSTSSAAQSATVRDARHEDPGFKGR